MLRPCLSVSFLNISHIYMPFITVSCTMTSETKISSQCMTPSITQLQMTVKIPPPINDNVNDRRIEAYTNRFFSKPLKSSSPAVSPASTLLQKESKTSSSSAIPHPRNPVSLLSHVTFKFPIILHGRDNQTTNDIYTPYCLA